MAKVRHRILVALVIILGVLAALVAGVQILLNSRVATRIVQKIAAENIEGDLDYDRLKITFLKTFPECRVTIDSLTLTYPHVRYSRFDGYGAQSPLLEEGRGSVKDTLAAFDNFSAAVNLKELMQGRLHLLDAHIHNMDAYLHFYDSTACNLDIFKFWGNSKKDTTEKKTPWLYIGPVDIAKSPHIVYTDQGNDVFACLDFQSLHAEGNVNLAPGDMQLRGIVLDIDKLDLAAKLRKDVYSLKMDSMDLTEPEADFFDLALVAEGGMITSKLGEIHVPVEIDAKVNLKQEPGKTSIVVPEFSGKLAYVPVTLDGSFVLEEGETYMDANVSIDDAPLGKIWSTYGRNLVPSLAGQVSTDAYLDLDASADGCLGGGKLPAVKATVHIPDCHASYKPIGIAGTLGVDVTGTMSADKVVDADVRRLRLNAPGLKLNAKGSGRRITSRNPSVVLKADAEASLQKVTPLLPKNMGIRGTGDVKLTLDAATTLAEIKNLRADIDALLSSDSLSVQLSSVMSIEAKELMAKVSDVKKECRLDGQINATSARMTQGDSLSVRIHGMENKLQMASSLTSVTDVENMGLESSFKMVSFNSGGARIGVRSLNLSASAAKRKRMQRMSEERRKHFLDSLQLIYPDVERDSLLRHMRRLSPRMKLPSYLSESDFRRKDIKIDVGDNLGKLLQKWQPFAHISSGPGRIITPSLPLRTRLEALDATLDDNVFDLNRVAAAFGSSDLDATGKVSGIRQMASGRGFLDLELDAKSGRVNLNEILAAFQAGKDKDKGDIDSGGSSEADEAAYEESIVVDTLENAKVEGMALFVVPANVRANVKLDVKRLDFMELNARNFKATADMRERIFQLTDASAATDVGAVALNAFYATQTKKDIYAAANVHFDELTADRIIQMLPAADSLMPLLRSFKGVMGADVAATARLDTNMTVLLPSVEGVVTLTGKDMTVSDVGDLQKVTKLLMLKNRNIGKIGDLNVCGLIHDSNIEVFPFLFQADRYKLALNGIQGLDGNFNYQATVLDWPLKLPFGINIFGKPKDWRFKVHEPLYQYGIPDFSDQMAQLHSSIEDAVRRVHEIGLSEAMSSHVAAERDINQKKEEENYSSEANAAALDAATQEKFDALVEQAEEKEQAAEIEQDIEALNRELGLEALEIGNEALDLGNEASASKKSSRRQSGRKEK